MTVGECVSEVWWLLRRSAPMSVTQLFYTLLMPSTLVFCGHLGTENLAAAGLAISLYSLTVENCATSIRWGLMPFLAQTMGGSKKHRVGNFVQRGLLAAVLLTSVNWAVALNSANLLTLVGQDPCVAAKSERFLLLLMPGSLAVNVGEALVAYMDTVGHLWPTFVSRGAVLCSNLLLQFALVSWAQLGLAGSAAALSLSLCLFPLLQATLICRCGIHLGTWSGFSTRAFLDWGKFFVTMLPCLVTQTLWVFGTEVGNFLAGLLGQAQIAAESVLFQLNLVAFLLPMGLGSALIARIGFYLGSQQPRKAVRAFGISVAFMSCVGAAVALLFFLLRAEVPRLFSLDAEATQLYVQLSPYLSVYTGLQLAAYPSVAALRACSYHLHTMLMNFFAYYVVSLPVGVCLTFAAGWGLRGLWIGFVLGSATFFLLPSAYLTRLDWERKAMEAHHSAELETDMELLNERQPLLLPEQEPLQSYQFSGSVSVRQRTAVRSKLPLMLGMLLLIAGSLALRLALPPAAGCYGNSTIVYNASAHLP